jgi:acyl-CoA synthetase (AMP-forming)/AMP-acid ligase II
MPNYGDVWARVAEVVPDRPAIIAGDLTLTYAGFDDEAARLATLMADRGIGFGSRVAVFMYNRAEYMTALFAMLKLGAIIVPINFRYRGREIADLLVDSHAEALIYPASFEEFVADGLEAMAPDRPMLFRVDDGADTPSASRLDATDVSESRTAARRPSGPAPTDGELYLYTGGTTGRPKAVVWPVDVLFEVQLFSIYTSVGLAVPDSAEAMADTARDLGEAAPVVLPLAPFMHGTALFNAMNAFVLGGTLVILPQPRFDPESALDLIRAHSVTRLIVAGDSVAQPLLDEIERSGVAGLPSVRTVISSGMRFSDSVKARMHDLGRITITDLLAATEGGPFAVATSSSADELPARLKLLPDAVVVDDDNNEIQGEPGRIGRLAFRGTLPTGYLGDPDKTAAAYPLIDGVRHLVSGDFVRVEEDAHVELLGRGSSVINSGGEKIYPGEVEAALLEHPDIVDAVVFGMPDRRWGEAVTAVVATTPAADVSEAQLRDHLRGRVADYKRPKHIDVRDTLDRSPSGKLDMARLRQGLTDNSDG